MHFTYHLPVNLLFGRGRFTELGTVTVQYGTRALLVTGKHSTKRSGVLARALDYLKQSGVEATVFDQVPQNPLTTTVYAGAALAKQEGCKVVIGIGGGSIMDCAKGIAFQVCNGGDISDYIFGRKQSSLALPIVLVPTTCGTGSEGNGFAVLTNPDNGDKKSLRTTAIVAKASIIDPALMSTMPKQVLASVGFDALCHNMEAYLSKTGQPLTEMMALQGIRLVGKNLPRVYQDKADSNAWDALSWGSTLGGMVINTAGITAPHGMEHPVSGLRNVVHGHGLAALTPVIYDRSIFACPEKFSDISRALGGTDEKDCVKAIRTLLKEISLETTLSRGGVRADDVEWLTKNCAKVSMAGMQAHPAVFDERQTAQIYREAL
ncbi:MAG: iron-containing alcohol dehydrogenase [Oscillospiraceae bacterium]|jgi:alcohol dehydrogenase class IV|nr:iron-containing alcohol dehydrogenase [Oscillospiraceae bacterium]MCI1991095.1 iron-containing alcohol dehydrogenase [Oscillospiraceae bacterium]MCI2036319.1 iron-containing alcohol dehydrogenase [Oscillospiraceae bacterium]